MMMRIRRSMPAPSPSHPYTHTDRLWSALDLWACPQYAHLTLRGFLACEPEAGEAILAGIARLKQQQEARRGDGKRRQQQEVA